MPYIDPRDYEAARLDPCTPGELTYKITHACIEFLIGRMDIKEINYADYARIIGILECSKLEIYRRMVAPYEDQKQVKNGDVFPHQ